MFEHYFVGKNLKVIHIKKINNEYQVTLEGEYVCSEVYVPNNKIIMRQFRNDLFKCTGLIIDFSTAFDCDIYRNLFKSAECKVGETTWKSTLLRKKGKFQE